MIYKPDQTAANKYTRVYTVGLTIFKFHKVLLVFTSSVSLH
jgi:hypothetical protein